MSEDVIFGGCILLARQILSSEIWKKPTEYLKIWLYIILKVNHKDNKLFPRGSNFFNWSEEINNLAGIKKTTIVNCIKWLKFTNQITTQKTTRGMIIKVNNYDTYQDMENYKMQYQVQHQIQNRYSTDTVQVQNKYNTINNNEIMKECNNDNNILPHFKIPSVEEVTQYCLSRNNGIDAEAFVSFYQSKGWRIGRNPMKCWRSAIITWEKKNKQNNAKGQKWEI